MQVMDERTHLKYKIAKELEAMHLTCKPFIDEAVRLQVMLRPKVTLCGSDLTVMRKPLPEGFQELIDLTQAPFIERINGLLQQLKRTDTP